MWFNTLVFYTGFGVLLAIKCDAKPARDFACQPNVALAVEGTGAVVRVSTSCGSEVAISINLHPGESSSTTGTGLSLPFPVISANSFAAPRGGSLSGVSGSCTAISAVNNAQQSMHNSGEPLSKPESQASRLSINAGSSAILSSGDANEITSPASSVKTGVVGSVVVSSAEQGSGIYGSSSAGIVMLGSLASMGAGMGLFRNVSSVANPPPSPGHDSWARPDAMQVPSSSYADVGHPAAALQNLDEGSLNIHTQPPRLGSPTIAFGSSDWTVGIPRSIDSSHAAPGTPIAESASIGEAAGPIVVASAPQSEAILSSDHSLVQHAIASSSAAQGNVPLSDSNLHTDVNSALPGARKRKKRNTRLSMSLDQGAT